MLLAYCLKRRLSLAMHHSPRLIYVVERLKLRLKSAEHRVVCPETKLVIEGPPRCGNSSALRLVTSNNPSFKKNVATHIHRSFQLYFALRYDVPAIVMLRSPMDSTISHASLLCQLGQVKVETEKELAVLLCLCVEEYLAFVRDIHRIGFRQIVVFEDYVNRPDSLITFINQEYQLGLKCGGYVQNDDEAVHVFPNEERNRLKQSFVKVAQDVSKIRRLMQTAEHYYDLLIAERVLPNGD